MTQDDHDDHNDQYDHSRPVIVHLSIKSPALVIFCPAFHLSSPGHDCPALDQLLILFLTFLCYLCLNSLMKLSALHSNFLFIYSSTLKGTYEGF